MNLRNKREELSSQIRKIDHQAYFKKIRMSLQEIQSSQETHSQQQFATIGPQQILEAIRCFRKQKQPLNFVMINEYVLASAQPFSQIICQELANVVLDSHRMNGHAIAALAHTLNKCTHALFLNNISNISGKIMQLIDQNMTGENKMKNGQAIAYLIFNILYFSQNKEDFYFLPKYYETFSNSSGYFDRALLFVLHASSVCRQLLPSSNFVQGMLHSQINYNQLGPLDFKIICQFLQNYVCFDLKINLNIDLVKWISKRLKQKKFPLSLKASLIKIYTITLSYKFFDDYPQQCDGINFEAVQEIIQIARFGVPQSKVQAINCLCQFIDILSSQKIKDYVQNTLIFQVILYSLELSLQAQQYFNLLKSIALIFCIDKKYYKMAERLAIKPLLYRFFTCKVVKVANMAKQIMQLFHSYD